MPDPMTPERMKEIADRATALWNAIIAATKNNGHFTLSIPADPTRDLDLLAGQLVTDTRDLLAALTALRAEHEHLQQTFARQHEEHAAALTAANARVAELEAEVERFKDCPNCREVCEACDRRNQKDEARIAELEAIIAKLPKTADGVPLTGGDIAFHPSGGYVMIPGVSHDGPVQLIGGYEEIVKGGRFTVPSRCYSTREAALAAKGKA